MSFVSKIEKLPLPELIIRFNASDKGTREEAYADLEQVAIAIGEKGKQGLTFLKTRAATADQNQLRAIIMGLSYAPSNDNEIHSTLRMLLKDKRPLIVAAAIDGLIFQEQDQLKSDIARLAANESVHVKNAVLRYLTAFEPETAYPLLLEALAHKDAMVRENAADALGELGDERAIPHLQKLLNDTNSDVKDAAEGAIENLSG